MASSASTFWMLSIPVALYSVYIQTPIENLKSLHFTLIPIVYAYYFIKTAILLLFQLLFFPVWPFIWSIKLIWSTFISEPLSLVHKSMVAIYPAFLFFAAAIACGFFIGGLGRVIMEISSAMLVVHFDGEDKGVNKRQEQPKEEDDIEEYDKEREREELLSLVDEWRKKQQYKSRSSSISSNTSAYFTRSNGLLSHGTGLSMLASDNELKRQ
ncbi:hypothetical protein K501DRAFT_16240 [Backusella circina FSU 941]|nr:hypothetical protein K501DRAFT_16240 [Backusella circina FSU 941]